MRRSKSEYKVGFILLGLSVLLGTLLHICIGSYLWIQPQEIFKEIFWRYGEESPIHQIIWELRLPRAFGCALGGGLLGGVGALFQTLFQNPLAEPYILGVSSGAAIGGILAMLLNFSGLFFGLGTLFCSILFGLGSLASVTWLAKKQGILNTPSLLLSGVVMSTLQSALITLLMALSGKDLNTIFRWLMGSATPMFWNKIFLMALTLGFTFIALYKQCRSLNALAISESFAQSIGVDTNSLKNLVLLLGTIMTAITVGAMGILGFVGLIAPHISRRIFGIDMRLNFPTSIAIGALILLFSDLIAQRMTLGMEVPIGVITALLSSPILLTLLRAQVFMQRK